MMMDQSLASLFTREREDYFGRFFHSLGECRAEIRMLQSDFRSYTAANLFLRQIGRSYRIHTDKTAKPQRTYVHRPLSQ
jgi:hypothetical protein